MDIQGSVALVTGANRGLGKEFVGQLLERGAKKVYATARDVSTITTPGVVPLALDLLDQASVERAARQAGDVTLLVNNAGISTGQNLVRGDLAQIRREMDTHFFGTLGVTRAFADVLGNNGGGAIVNVLSALSWFSWNGATSYSAAKAAEWSLTAGTRVELAGQGTQVLGLHLGAADTDMMAGYEGPLLKTSDVVRAALDGLAAGSAEVLVDDWSRIVKAGLAEDPAEFYAKVAANQL
ncbi:SDR family oxidoreductase [Nocardia sp. NRRL S-836]|uniref:SDR family oxidoreductase n=1 Tax=Nocardia sp. NRRL S-836 TaxID=1519492 RepID=UPI0006ADA0FD|nr:SDR family oxidoreductase [Nocardia sp. NRRL S-836]KOV87212.1 short-chain dehydrogenase [Nocardia sp. NRRL S-836]